MIAVQSCSFTLSDLTGPPSALVRAAQRLRGEEVPPDNRAVPRRGSVAVQRGLAPGRPRPHLYTSGHVLQVAFPWGETNVDAAPFVAFLASQGQEVETTERLRHHLLWSIERRRTVACQLAVSPPGLLRCSDEIAGRGPLARGSLKLGGEGRVDALLQGDPTLDVPLRSRSRELAGFSFRPRCGALLGDPRRAHGSVEVGVQQPIELLVVQDVARGRT